MDHRGREGIVRSSDASTQTTKSVRTENVHTPATEPVSPRKARKMDQTASSSKPIVTDEFDDRDMIAFVLPSTYVGEVGLHQLYAEVINKDVVSLVIGDQTILKDKERAVARMVRDLQVVCENHVKAMMNTDLFPISAIMSPDFNSMGKNHTLLEGLSEVIEKLVNIMSMFNITLDDRETLPVPLRTKDTLQVLQMTTSRAWPMNNFGIYYSRLVRRLIGCCMTINRLSVEVVDFCLREHPTYLPDDKLFVAPGAPSLFRRDLMTINLDEVILPAVVRSWARVVIDVWDQVGRTHRTCLDVVEKGLILTREMDQLIKWQNWIVQCDIQLSKAELICIPLYMEGHYNLLCINFRTRMVQCIDTRTQTNRSDWDDFARLTVFHFWRLLDKKGDGRFVYRNEFRFEVFHPHWSTPAYDSSSGLTAMHLIDHLGEPDCDLSSFKLHEEYSRIQLRVSICSAIVISRINLVRTEVLARVQKMIAEKNVARAVSM